MTSTPLAVSTMSSRSSRMSLANVLSSMRSACSDSETEPFDYELSHTHFLISICTERFNLADLGHFLHISFYIDRHERFFRSRACHNMHFLEVAFINKHERLLVASIPQHRTRFYFEEFRRRS